MAGMPASILRFHILLQPRFALLEEACNYNLLTRLLSRELYLERQNLFGFSICILVHRCPCFLIRSLRQDSCIDILCMGIVYHCIICNYSLQMMTATDCIGILLPYQFLP